MEKAMHLQEHDTHQISVIWRKEKFVLEMKDGATLKDLGDKLQALTNVKVDTLRLLVSSDKSSKMLYPFSDEHSHLTLDAVSILKTKYVRMMGVPGNEIDEILKNAKTDLRIAGFDEEEKRLKQRLMNRRHNSIKLPQGQYVFGDFRTLSLPGITLSPPASEALKLMHRLASDPGIVAIMNKHRWRVGIMTEMAPVGYVGISPKCVLGFNKNMGEEISLRLRTDDLKGFRKYDSIKKTLLHELAHMKFSEHDASFYALDSQLNKEAAALDWTKSGGHTLSGARHLSQYEEDDEIITNSVSSSHRVGGRMSNLSNARSSAASAAYQRFLSAPNVPSQSSEPIHVSDEVICEKQGMFESDSKGEEAMVIDSGESEIVVEPEPDSHEMRDLDVSSAHETCSVPDPDNSEVLEPKHENSGIKTSPKTEDTVRHDKLDCFNPESMEVRSNMASNGDSERDCDSVGVPIAQEMQTNEPDDVELQRIQDPVAVLCGRLQNAIETLRREIDPSAAKMVLQTLFKIISNVIDHPDEIKFKKLRKANALIQRNIVNHKAAMEFLTAVGFTEDIVADEFGGSETFLVLKRNDPGLLWLAKSTLETYIS